MKIAKQTHIVCGGIIVITVILSSVIIYNQLINTMEKQQWVNHTYFVISKFQNILTLLVNAETGARGYVITGNSTFLEPYNLSVDKVKSEYDGLVKLTADNDNQQKRLTILQPLITKKLLQLSQVILLTNSESNVDKATVLGNGKQIMDNIRQIIADAINDEQNLLDKRNKESETANNFTITLVIISAIVIGIVSIVMTYLINRSVKRELKETTKAKILEETTKAKDQFAAMMSHEIKTPIVPITGYTELLLDGTLGTLTDVQRAKIQIIYDNSLRMARLIQDMIDSYRMGLDKLKLDIKQVNCNEIINQCVESFRPLAEKREILLTNKSTNNSIACDPNRIQQVLGNLISNSIKYVPSSKGVITVSTKLDTNYLVFTVEDNGVGIPKDKQSELFHPFYQADTSLTRKPGGTGLGLSISKGLIELHGGKIWIESEENKGTAVHFTIPFMIKN